MYRSSGGSHYEQLETFIDQGFNVIVTVGFLMGTDTTIAAKENPDVTFIGVDQGICIDENADPDPTFGCAGDAAALLPNYQGIVFAEKQAGIWLVSSLPAFPRPAPSVPWAARTSPPLWHTTLVT